MVLTLVVLGGALVALAPMLASLVPGVEVALSFLGWVLLAVALARLLLPVLETVLIGHCARHLQQQQSEFLERHRKRFEAESERLLHGGDGDQPAP